MTRSPALQRWRRRFPSGRGFTLTELMVTVAVLGILSGVVINVGWREWRREQVNSVVLELAGWLQMVRRGALTGNSCQVTITPAAYAAGDLLAQVSPCGTVQSLRLIGLSGNQNVVVSIQGVANNTFTFTPAGTLSPPPSAADPIVISVMLEGHEDTRRCVQLDGLLGALDLGVVTDAGCAVGGGI